MADDAGYIFRQAQFKGVDVNLGSARIPMADHLVTAKNVRMVPDGSLKWSRDQFRIQSKSAVTVKSLYEFKNSTYNQLLEFASDGGLYALTSDWPNATPDEWTYGYELFKETTSLAWTTIGATDETTGQFALAGMWDNLYILQPGARMLRYDGAELLDVGMLGPFSPPVGDTEADNFLSTSTPWTETDTGGYLTVTSSRVTAASLPYNAASYFYRAKDSDDFDYRFEFYVDSATAVNGSVMLFALCDLAGSPFSAWTDYIYCRADYNDATVDSVTLVLRAYPAGGAAAVYEMLFDTNYYCRLSRHGTTVTWEISASSDLSNSTTLRITASAASHPYVHLLAPWDNDGAGTFSGYVQNVILTADNATAGNLYAGAYAYAYTWVRCDADGAEIWESMPSPASTTVLLATDGWKIALAGIQPGPTLSTSQTDVMYRKLYRAETTDETGQTAVGSYRLVQRIDDNTTTTYTDNVSSVDLGDEIPYDYAVPPWGSELCFHADRLWAARIVQTSESYTGGLYKDDHAPYITNLQNILFYSALSAPQYWPALNQITVGDSAPIVGLCSWRKHLFIFKTNGVWVLTGYDDDTFDLEYLDTNGLCAYRAYASSNAGVIWASHRGIMFFNGSNVQTLTSYVDGALTRPQFADGEYPKMAWANGRYYVLSGTDLYWWDSEYDVWGQETMGAVGTAGIQGFQLGDKQSHILCLRKWNNSTSDSDEITALHTEEAFSDFASAGASDGNYFAPIEVEFAPFIPEPDEDVVVTRFSLDGFWTDNDMDADKMTLYWGTTSAASTELGDAPQGARQYQVPNSVRGNPVYLRIAANYAEDLVLRNVKVEFTKVTRGEQTL